MSLGASGRTDTHLTGWFVSSEQTSHIGWCTGLLDSPRSPHVCPACVLRGEDCFIFQTTEEHPHTPTAWAFYEQTSHMFGSHSLLNSPKAPYGLSLGFSRMVDYSTSLKAPRKSHIVFLVIQVQDRHRRISLGPKVFAKARGCHALGSSPLRDGETEEGCRIVAEVKRSQDILLYNMLLRRTSNSPIRHR